MKVVLREHVEQLGDRGDIVSVAAGFARNYLIPKRMAAEATPGNLKVIQQQRRVWAVREAKETTEAEALAARLSSVELEVTKKAGETGTLYGAVTKIEIAEMLAGKGFEVDRRRIVLKDPIKTVGEFEIPIKIYRTINGLIKLRVISESGANREEIIEIAAPEIDPEDDDRFDE